MVIAFFGHSDFSADEIIKEKLLETLRSLINDSEAELLLGGYGGVDRFALNCGKCYKKENFKAKLILVTPYLNRSHSEGCEYDETLYPTLEKVPYRYAISARNKWMVDRADVIISYIDREYGGAFKTFEYARKKKKVIINLALTERVSDFEV